MMQTNLSRRHRAWAMDVFGVIVLVTTEGIEENGVDAMRPSQMDRRGDVLGQKVEGAGDGNPQRFRDQTGMTFEFEGQEQMNEVGVFDRVI